MKQIFSKLVMVATVFATMCFFCCSSNVGELEDKSASENNLIGEWRYLSNARGLYYTFNNDGTYKARDEEKGLYDGNGYWKLDGNRLSMRWKDSNSEVWNMQIDQTVLILDMNTPTYHIFTKDGYLKTHSNNMIIGKWQADKIKEDGNRDRMELKKDGTYIYNKYEGKFIIFNDFIYSGNGSFDRESILKLDNTTLHLVGQSGKVYTYTRVQ